MTNNKLNNVDIPDNVVNADAYLKYIELCSNPYLCDESARMVQTSDPALVIDIATPHPHVERMTAHLPGKEKHVILAKCKVYSSLNLKKGQLASRAFGQGKLATYLEDVTELDPRKGELIKAFGSFNTVEDVYKMIVSDWKLPVSMKTVKNFAEKYKQEIKDAQEDFKRDYSYVRLGYKRSRLEEYSYIYSRNKDKLEATDFNNVAIQKLNLDILKAIKDEVEGSEINVNINGEVNVNHSIQTYINSDVLAKMPVQCIVLSKLSARFGMNPNLLLHRLQTSIYAKNMGIIKTEDNVHDIKIMYPSEHVYEFDKLRRLNESVNIEDAKVVGDLDSPGDSPNIENDRIKAAALATLKVQKENASNARVRIKIKSNARKEGNDLVK